MDLNNGDYELGLMNFETYNTISNVNSTINFTSTTKRSQFPRDCTNCISKYLKDTILHKTRTNGVDIDVNDDVDDDDYIYDNEDVNDEEIIILRANKNTMRSVIKCAYAVNFIKPNNICLLLGFSKSRILQPNK